MDSKRVRTGCTTCRRRRVKCDEQKPICNRCKSANYHCEGYRPTKRAPTASSSSPQQSTSPRSVSSPEETTITELSPRHTTWRPEQLPLYHHFVTTTAVKLFRNDHINFWRDQVAQMSYGLDIVYEALLAIGAIHRSTLLICQHGNTQEAAKLKVLGLRAYGKTLQLLPNHLNGNPSADSFAVLAVLILLTYFECILDNPQGAFRHLWAAIQLLRKSENSLPEIESSSLVPIYDTLLRLDFLAQKLVPYASTSFLRGKGVAMMERPSWNRPSPDFSGAHQSDLVADEGHRLIQLICSHNSFSRIVWGCWCPLDQRPSRDELLGFYSEMMLWKANSPATFASYKSLEALEALDRLELELFPMPPPLCQFSSSEAALNIAMFNGYLGCAVAMISTTDPDPTIREREAFSLVYQNLCIAAGLIDDYGKKKYKPCDSISMGISLMLYHGARRCFSLSWEEWTITALRALRREGLSNGFTAANTIAIMCQLEAKMTQNDIDKLLNTGTYSALGPLRDRLMPILMPRGDDETIVSYYLRYGYEGAIGDEEAIQVVAKATWKEDQTGAMHGLQLNIYDQTIPGGVALSPGSKVDPSQLFDTWRQAVETGWHGCLSVRNPE